MSADLKPDNNQTINLKPEQAAAKAALLAECEKLAAAGVTLVAVHFDGSGDEGVTEEPCCYDTEDYDYGEDDAMELDASHLHRHFHTLVPSGFEIDGGGFGDVILDVKARKITVEHTERIQYYITKTYEI